jgi:hypothetical protein
MELPTQVPDLPPKRKRGRRIRSGLCAIRNFIERLLTPTTIVVITVLLLVASWVYPPWVSYGRYPSHDWYFIFDTSTGSMRIDLARLLLIDLIIAVPGGLLAWTISRSSAARRMTARIVFYSIAVLVLAPPTVAIVSGGTLLIQNVQRDAANRATETKHFDPATVTLLEKPSSVYDKLLIYLSRKRPISVEIPGHGIVEFPNQMTYNEIAAVIKKNFVAGQSEAAWTPPPEALPVDGATAVAPDDLKKITLFDVGPDFGSRHGTCIGFYGRVRNDLSRAVERVGLKASFYNAQGKLIEIRTFWLAPSTGIFPNTPISFEEVDASGGSNNLHVDDLPDGWKYHLEVTEARYVKWQANQR